MPTPGPIAIAARGWRLHVLLGPIDRSGNALWPVSLPILEGQSSLPGAGELPT
jgi:hypothetical protein